MEVIAVVAGFIGLLIVCCVCSMLFDEFFVDPVTRWNDRRLAKATAFECGIRVTSGKLPGFTKAWRHGPTTVSPGVIRFKNEVIHVVSVAARSRQPLLGECYWSSFDHRVVVITTEAGEIEFAARRPQLPTIRKGLSAGPSADQ